MLFERFTIASIFTKVAVWYILRILAHLALEQLIMNCMWLLHKM